MPVQRALKLLGRDIATARRRRRISQRLMADRMLVSLQSVQRLEAGDPTVGVSILASALFVLGMTPRLETLAAPEHDMAGMQQELERLPKRAHADPKPDLDF